MNEIAPTTEFILSVFWLGHITDNGDANPIGSGVAIKHDGVEYLATALHVAKDCNFNPLIRRQRKWQAAKWETIGADESVDIAVLKTYPNKLIRLQPRYGTGNVIIGGIGRAMGFPNINDPNELDRYAETPEGHPVPMAVLVSSYVTPRDDGIYGTNYTGGYINAGFSGGAMLFPTGDSWTIAGIITKKGYTYTKGYPGLEHSGLIGYCDIDIVKKLIEESVSFK